MNRIKGVLEEQGIKQTWLAENWAKVIIWRMLMHRRQPSLETLFKILELLNTEVRELLNEKK
jgi:putative transcriptional regulator